MKPEELTRMVQRSATALLHTHNFNATDPRTAQIAAYAREMAHNIPKLVQDHRELLELEQKAKELDAAVNKLMASHDAAIQKLNDAYTQEKAQWEAERKALVDLVEKAQKGSKKQRGKKSPPAPSASSEPTTPSSSKPKTSTPSSKAVGSKPSSSQEMSSSSNSMTKP